MHIGYVRVEVSVEFIEVDCVVSGLSPGNVAFGVLTSMDADPNTYPILILPASNTFYFTITHSLIIANPTMLNPSSIML